MLCYCGNYGEFIWVMRIWCPEHSFPAAIKLSLVSGSDGQHCCLETWRVGVSVFVPVCPTSIQQRLTVLVSHIFVVGLWMALKYLVDICKEEIIMTNIIN